MMAAATPAAGARSERLMQWVTDSWRRRRASSTGFELRTSSFSERRSDASSSVFLRRRSISSCRGTGDSGDQDVCAARPAEKQALSERATEQQMAHPARKVAKTLRESALQVASCMESMRVLQRDLADGLKEYLCFVAPVSAVTDGDSDITSSVPVGGSSTSHLGDFLAAAAAEVTGQTAVPTLCGEKLASATANASRAQGFLQSLTDFLEETDSLFSMGCLGDIIRECDSILDRCEKLDVLMRAREGALQKLQHYEQKVAQMQDVDVGAIGCLPFRGLGGGCASKPLASSPVAVDAMCADDASDIEENEHLLGSKSVVPAKDRLGRNLQKLAEAKVVSDERCEEWETQLQSFEGSCAKHVGTAADVLLTCYMRFAAAWGERATKAAGACVDSRRGDDHARLIEAATPADATTSETQDSEGDSHASASDADSATKDYTTDCVLLDTEPQVAVFPEAGPSHGCEVEVSCSGLDGSIHEIFVDGIKADIIEATPTRARIRMPSSAAAGTAAIEVRTEAWHKHVAFAQAGFRYFEPVWFGSCGRNVTLQQPDGASSEALPTIAMRSTGLVDGVALTARPLTTVCEQPSVADEPGGPCRGRYYFEAVVQAVSGKKRGTTRTLSIGFAWPLARSVSDTSVDTGGVKVRLPEMANQMKCAFVVGGDLPRVFLAGRPVKSVTGWRPLFDTVAGVSLGALLEADVSPGGNADDGVLRLMIFQDGVLRCTTEAAAPADWLEVPPHGVVDVCGNVLGIELRQGAQPPLPRSVEEAASPVSVVEI
eukprot:TRINITY_DN43644_c0_g1_i1.p1 TRINITY_DN43644_c0_g1~~TRINITY_DN43644_c0_g1_i1.p1  ORF type:complete len:805 (-),score=128.97 TRINITY_DN43644_c0_g1_i1:111-2432(-)